MVLPTGPVASSTHIAGGENHTFLAVLSRCINHPAKGPAPPGCILYSCLFGTAHRSGLQERLSSAMKRARYCFYVVLWCSGTLLLLLLLLLFYINYIFLGRSRPGDGSWAQGAIAGESHSRPGQRGFRSGSGSGSCTGSGRPRAQRAQRAQRA